MLANTSSSDLALKELMTSISSDLHQILWELNAELEKRMCTACEVHDTLVQSFHRLFQSAHNLLSGPFAAAIDPMERAASDGPQAITQARDAIQGLHSSTVVTSGLENALEILAGELAAHQRAAHGDAAAFSMVIEGTSQELNPALRGDIYQIAGEALRNAFRHARARRIEMEIRYGARQLRVRVRDDGIGIDAGVLSRLGHAGHRSLRGMCETAKRAGARLEFWSEHGAGTEVEVTIPSSIAHSSHSSRCFRLFKGNVRENS